MSIKRSLPIAAIMLVVWGLMIALLVAIEKLVVPLELPFLPSSPPYPELIKLFVSTLLALAWLYLWNFMVKIYCRRASHPD